MYGLRIIICLLAAFGAGCVQDYTVLERMLVSGKLYSTTERQNIGFVFDNQASFPDVQARIVDWGTAARKIEITKFDRLNQPAETGVHYELWAVSPELNGTANRVSFGKFVVQNGSLYEFRFGVPGTRICSDVPSGQSCIFNMTAGSPLFNDLAYVQISLEPAGDSNLTQDGSIGLSGAIINENGGLVEPLRFPISFSKNGVVATASAQLFAEDAQKGQVTMTLKGFPQLTNKFAYQLWAADDINGFSSCGIFNVKDGVIVNTTTLLPKGSNIFNCGVDLTQRNQLVISLEPTFLGNSSGIYDYIPYRATYLPFTNQSLQKFSIYNVRASIAGTDEDRALTDVEGNFNLPTTHVGKTYLVLRGLNHEPAYQQIEVIRAKNISGLNIPMIPKVPKMAVFHVFQNDYDKTLTSVKVIGNFQVSPFDPVTAVTLNDSGDDGDLIKGDGIFTARVTGISKSVIDYQFIINGNDPSDDLHAEKLAEYDGSDYVSKCQMNIRQ